MTDWLELCRAAVADVDAVLERLPTRAEREPVVGAGEGGDETTAIDQAAEEAILARVREAAGAIVSEETGRVGGAGLPLVVVDPIDGSLNAKRGIPFFALSIAVAEGETMDDVVFGFVHDFGSREEWTARRGEGAWLNGELLGSVRPKDEVEILSFEATLTSLVARDAPKVADLAHRLRIMGSLALSPPVGSTPSARSSRRARSTSPRRSSSVASWGSRSTCSTSRSRSGPLPSTSSSARGSSRPVRRRCATASPLRCGATHRTSLPGRSRLRRRPES